MIYEKENHQLIQGKRGEVSKMSILRYHHHLLYPSPILKIRSPIDTSLPPPLPLLHRRRPLPSLLLRSAASTSSMDTHESSADTTSMKLLFVEMGVGYDQHGQDITAAAMRACRDAISSNSIPAFKRGSIPGVNSDQMKLRIKLGVPRSIQHLVDVERVKSVFPYGTILNVDIVDGGLICSSGVLLEAMGDRNEDCYVVNAAVYVGY